jgi:succinoglycan biosynthesis protein ExoA
VARRREVISVVVPVRNESRYIERLLQQLVSQELPPGALEIVVADGRSTDDTRDRVTRFAARYPFIKLIDNPRQLSSAGRNLGVRHSTGDYVVVVDGHCDLKDRQYLKNLVELFHASGADCLGRPQPLVGGNPTRVQAAVALARASWVGHNPSSLIFSGGNVFADPSSIAVAYRRSVFEAIGLFDDRFDACEDVELNHRVRRAKLSCFFSEAIRLDYVPRASFPGLFRQMTRYGRGRVRLVRKHRKAFSWPLAAPPALAALFVTTALSALCCPVLFAPQMIIVLAYVILLLLESARIYYKKQADALTCVLLPAALVTIHLGVANGVLRELLAGRTDFQAPEMRADCR